VLRKIAEGIQDTFKVYRLNYFE